MDLSMCFAEGLTQPHTMKLKGKVVVLSVLVLIDSGVSWNFIALEYEKNQGLKVEQTLPYKVRLGDW
jgi:hypothetical protein